MVAEQGLLAIEVAFALPDVQVVLELTVPEGTTLAQAVEQADIQSYFPDTDLAPLPKGIFGEVRPDDTVLAAHDRVEIYRPLERDPKRARRERVAADRAAAGPRVRGKGDGAG
tara:strand:+ start:931 stop:1269 length:339 start_codon:yes stop_codon:yes gene_type:complete